MHDGGVTLLVVCVAALVALLVFALGSAMSAGAAVERWHVQLDQFEIQVAQTRKTFAEQLRLEQR